MEVANGLDGFDLDKIDELVTQLMGHAFLAQAYGDALARDPSLIGGFGKLAEKHRSAVATLSSEIGRAAVSLGGMAAAPFAVGRRQGRR